MNKVKRLPHMVFNGSTIIQAFLDKGQAGAFGKIGGTEGKALSLGAGVWTKYLHYNRYLRYRKKLYLKSGVFPESNRQFEDFISRYAEEALPGMDALCCWRGSSDFLARDIYARKSRLIDWDCLSMEPLTRPHSWVQALEGKRILIVTSFAQTVPAQAQNIKRIWPNRPDLHALEDAQVLPCPMYAHLKRPKDASWTHALERLRLEMEAYTFDVCLIAAGAWSLFLAVHAKKMGAVGIHMGGALQLLFGISGNRWETYGSLSGIKNEYWCFPCDADTPSSFEGTEDAAYWKK